MAIRADRAAASSAAYGNFFEGQYTKSIFCDNQSSDVVQMFFHDVKQFVCPHFNTEYHMIFTGQVVTAARGASVLQ